MFADDAKSEYFQQATELLSLNFKGPKEYGPKDIEVVLRAGMFRLFVLLLPDPFMPGSLIVAGTAFTIIYFKRKAMHLEYLAVSNSFQGLGLGKLIVSKLMSYDRERETPSSPSSTTMSLKLALLTLECKADLIGYYEKMGAQNSGLTQVWEIDYGNGALVTGTHHFLFFPLDVKLLEAQTSSSLTFEEKVTEIRSDLQSHHNLAEELIKLSHHTL